MSGSRPVGLHTLHRPHGNQGNLEVLPNLFRLYKLDEADIRRLQNQKYIEKEFLLSVSFVAAIVIFLTVFFMVTNHWIRLALLKGLMTCIIIYAGVKVRRLWK